MDVATDTRAQALCARCNAVGTKSTYCLFSELNPLPYIHNELDSKRILASFPMVCSDLRFGAEQRRYVQKTRRNLSESILLTGTVAMTEFRAYAVTKHG